MKEINKEQIVEGVYKAIYRACHQLNTFTLNKLEFALSHEDNALAKETLKQILENASLAKEESIPMCQDTGILTAFVYLGRDVHLNCSLDEAINEAVKKAYTDFYLRKSVADPLNRINTQDNTPAIVHTTIAEGDELVIKIAPKGAGSENMSKIKMLNPTEGKEGIISFVLDTLKQAGGRPCPPLFLGIGIGGNFETSALMAKEALLNEGASKDPQIAQLEQEILTAVNELDIGPMGLGGKTTVLSVFIKTAPCHIASLPVAINIQCHANRHEEVRL